MIKGISITNLSGKTLKLILDDPDESGGIYISNIEGLGYPSGDVQTNKVSGMPISTCSSTSMSPRNIVISVGIIEDVETTRHYIYDHLWSNSPLEIEIITDERPIKATGYIESVEPNIFSSQETIQISIICPDPYFYTSGIITYESSHVLIGEPNFGFEQINENFGDIWFDGLLGVGKPVGIIDNKILELNVMSRFQNPRGFYLEILPNHLTEYDSIDGQPGFNKVILTYPNGEVTINKNDLNIDEYSGKIVNNFFFNSSLVIFNDYKHQGIYKRNLDTYALTDILNNCIINGDFPSLLVGMNKFKCNLTGFVNEKTNRPISSMSNPTYQDSDTHLLIYFTNDDGTYNSSNFYSIDIKYKAEFVTCYVYDENNNFICRLKLSTSELSQKENSEKTYLYRFEETKNITDGNGYDIGIIRWDKNIENPDYKDMYLKTPGEKDFIIKYCGPTFEEGDYKYRIFCFYYPVKHDNDSAAINSVHGDGDSALKIDVEVSKINVEKPFESLYALISKQGNFKPILKTTSYVIKTFDEEVTDAVYKDVSEDFKIVVGHDELYDAL